MKPFKPTMQAREHLLRELIQGDKDLMICFAECHFHTVEACVAIKKLKKIDELELFLLQAVNRLKQPTAESMNNLLHIGSQIIRQIATSLVGSGLLQENTDGYYQVTKQGFDALQSKEMVTYQQERCHFHFVNGNNEFLRIRDSRKIYLRDLAPKETGDNWSFNIETLKRCINESDQWKRERGFSGDVVRLITEQDTDSKKQIAIDTDNTVEENTLSACKLTKKENTLIVDKAVGANCAIIVKFQDDRFIELKAYPFLSKGFLHSGDQNVLFSLNGTDSILKVFPGMDIVPSSQQIDLAWQSIGQDYNLRNLSRTSIKADKTSMTVTLNSELISEWLRFCWQAIKGEIFCCIELEDMTRLNYVSLEAADKEANEQLQALKLLHLLKSANRVENILCDVSIYRQWLSAGDFPIDPDIYELASLAWKMGEFGLAYRLAELKDIADAEL